MASPDCKEGLEFLSQPYVGRLVIVGLSEEGNWRLITGMGGRSVGSNNRFYKELEDLNRHGNYVRTAIHDMSKETGDPSTTLYVAHRSVNGVHVASNGEQTDGVCFCMAHGVPFEEIQSDYQTEGPKTDYTARITAAVPFLSFWAQMGRIERDSEDYVRSNYRNWRILRVRGGHDFPSVEPGSGYLVTTYNGEGGTEPNYLDPLKVPLPGCLEDTMDLLWGTWTSNRSGLCGKEIIGNDGPQHFVYAYRSIHLHPGHPELD